MSKRCKLQSEYYRYYGSCKGLGKYSDHYVNWLERKILALNIQNVSKCCSKRIVNDLKHENYCSNCGNIC